MDWLIVGAIMFIISIVLWILVRKMWNSFSIKMINIDKTKTDWDKLSPDEQARVLADLILHENDD